MQHCLNTCSDSVTCEQLFSQAMNSILSLILRPGNDNASSGREDSDSGSGSDYAGSRSVFEVLFSIWIDIIMTRNS